MKKLANNELSETRHFYFVEFSLTNTIPNHS